MKKDELLSSVGQEIENSYGASSGELSYEIAKAMSYYLGEPFGNEEDGQSQVVSMDVRDVIEWQLPSLMKIFTSTDKAVIFDPVDPSDEDSANQETLIINHSFYKENNGYLQIYNCLKDGLLSKNGIFKVYWDSTEENEREEYSGLTDDELQVLLLDEEIDPIEHSEENGLHDITILRKMSPGTARVESIPPEEFRISKDATSIEVKKARFCCHVTRKTKSDLIAMGFSKRKVNSLPAWKQFDDSDIGRARNNKDDDQYFDDTAHESTRQIEIHECYYKIDFDGDGIAELRQITLAGKEILINEPVDSVPFIAWTPNMIPHKFHGISSADEAMDIQLIKSTLLRGVLNNTYLANNARTAVQDGMVNLDDLLTNRSGGVVRTLGPPSQVMQGVPYNQLPPQTFQVMGQMDEMRKERTGVSGESMGLDANVLAHGKTGVVAQSYEMARQRVEMVARNFAELAMKPMFLELHSILQKNQDKKKWIKLVGEWIQINPSEWRSRANMTVNVGLGTGNKDKQLQGIGAIIQSQAALKQQGFPISPQNEYNAQEKLVEAAGFKEVDQFFTDPRTVPPQQPKPDPQELLIQAQIQVANQQAETMRQEMETNRQEVIWKHEEKLKELTDKNNRELYDIELKYKFNVPGGLKSV